MTARFIGIDIGAETLKLVELCRGEDGLLRWTRRELVEHQKEPGPHLLRALARWGWPGGDLPVAGAAVTGRFAALADLPPIPVAQAQAAGYRHLFGDQPATLISIGGQGFSVLELRGGGQVYRENSRCSQGTGNFLRQLIERFGMTIEEAATAAAAVTQPAPLSGRCPVILKTDMTHLANKGEDRARILAGLFDAVCENVTVLVKPRVAPPRLLVIGGVSRSERVRANFARFAERHGMSVAQVAGDDPVYLEALGSAVLAAERPAQVPPRERLLRVRSRASLEVVGPLGCHLPEVKRLPPRPLAAPGGDVVLGFDIGSTGSKAVALDLASGEVVWEGYLRTGGDPVGAARELLKGYVDGPASAGRLVAVGVTGSGREIVGSLLATCYGGESVFVLNEIAAHAAGALHFDPTVDTIFEIGGQDAKYIRLAGGRVVDAAMNEACSAGTGSFIEEQGRKFAGIESVVQLGEEALAAGSGVSLGQHCSVFMAEVIDEAAAAGVPQGSIIAGIYDSIIQNYLNRVKGSRTVGQVIFCQGMPFSAGALGAAVVRQTGARVVVPPNPGTVGALGIALLAREHLARRDEALDPARMLGSRVDKKDTFVCKSTQGCGGAGNKCRIDRIQTVVEGARQRFTWGGGCSLYDQGTRKQKLPDRAPDPFREREELIDRLVEKVSTRGDGPRVALTDEFQLKGLFPFFATFLSELGFTVEVHRGADQKALKRGIEGANVPFCAPMQQFHGLVSQMAAGRPDHVFLPMVRTMAPVSGERRSTLCPIVQAAPDMLRWDLPEEQRASVSSPLIDVGAEGLYSEEFARSAGRVAAALGVGEEERWWPALRAAREAQARFDADCLALGKRALDFARAHGLIPVVVLGRPYTIYNTVLNSNVPAILREQGALAIPVDCYEVEDTAPVYDDVYWGHAQRNLRAAHQVRRTQDVWALFCSNYSCGPDSFTLHFFSYLMDGKPFAVIETDGHSGDAGTKTRVEAFLHCVREERRSAGAPREPSELERLAARRTSMNGIRERGQTVLVPRMGPTAEMLSAALRGQGIAAETLPLPDRETLRLGRRHTSGKECVPMTITAGSLLSRLERAREGENFAFLMPSANGPCRFGVYQLLHKVILERLGLSERVTVWSPADANYFEGVPPGFAALVFGGFMAGDLLQEALYDVRPVETRPGAAAEIFARYHAELAELMEQVEPELLTLPAALLQVASGQLFGIADLLSRAGRDFARVKGTKELPTVLVVGEIYVRCDPFANDDVVGKLEERGLRVRFAPFNEWLEYTEYVNRRDARTLGFSSQLSQFVQDSIRTLTYSSLARALSWPPRTSVRETLFASSPYLREELNGEAVLTLGGPIHEWREGHIDAVVSVGPHECMPNKIAEAQFFHVAEREGLLSLTLSLNGEPIPAATLDNFAFEVHARFRQGRRAAVAHAPARPFAFVQPRWLVEMGKATKNLMGAGKAVARVRR